ncbi:helix-turn-helix transcriptional regulator [Chryseobacterium sp. Mn2064]|uniref:helix-turn-helix transcriptional regulator n=1 Tax=Chryseobacterium sp. Mn2064 TaxID=3395263 RepID=UPI003BBBCA21
MFELINVLFLFIFSPFLSQNEDNLLMKDQLQNVGFLIIKNHDKAFIYAHKPFEWPKEINFESNLTGSFVFKQPKNAQDVIRYLQIEQNKSFSGMQNTSISLQSNPEKEHGHYKKLYERILLVSFFIIAALVFISIYTLNKYKSKMNVYLIALNEKANKIAELEKKLNISSLEVVEYAKNNDLLFWPKFQETYPHFLNKMLLTHPNIKISELILCAYIYLGFSSKEIADYTFKSLRTIENNRYNLRKKLNLSNEIDFAVWIRRYVDDV